MSKNANLIAQATYQDGLSLEGDQLGYELNAVEWIDNSWIGVYRANDEAAREKLADFMERAVLNGYIGYKQATRMTLYNALLENGFNPDEINENVQCDCSSLVYCAIRSIYDVTFNQAPDRAPVTSEYDEFLTGTGLFTKYTGDEYLRTSENLVRGDILLKDGHVAMWI